MSLAIRSSMPSKKSQARARVKKESTEPNLAAGAVKSESDAVKPDPDEKYQEFPLTACSAADLAEGRHHILKFVSRVPIDPINKFSRPVRLHRKDPRNIQFHLSQKELRERRQQKEAERQAAELRKKAKAGSAKPAVSDGVVDVEMEDVEAEPATDSNSTNTTNATQIPDQGTVAPEPSAPVDLSVVAPDGGARKIMKKNLTGQPKTRQIRYVDDKVRKLRYEEYYPWVLEDYDGKNTWVGSYEAPASDSHALFVFDANGGFRMLPVSKNYKFTQRNRYATLTLEEAERKMEENKGVPRWLMKHLEETHVDVPRGVVRRKLKTVDDGGPSGERRRDDDAEELDYEEEFADDEEAPLVDGDEEENREVEKRLKKEMKEVKSFADGAEDEAEDEEVKEEEEEEKLDKEGKRLKKLLRNLDANTAYDSDDEDTNPYLPEEEEEEEPSTDQPSRSPGSKAGSPSPSPGGATRLQMRAVIPKNEPVGFVVIKASKQILEKFPAGEWNANVKKRKLESSIGGTGVGAGGNGDSVAKKVKLEDGGKLMTEQDVVAAIGEGGLTTKELLHKLKSKIAEHPQNRNLVKTLFLKVGVMRNGKVYPRAK